MSLCIHPRNLAAKENGQSLVLPSTTGGIVFNILYVFLGVGLFIIFVLEAGKTMVHSYEEFTTKLAERRALKRAKKETRHQTPASGETIPVSPPTQ